MNQWLTEHLYDVIVTALGGGSLFGWWTERKKKRIEERQLAANALESMQTAYDKFVIDSKSKYEELSSEISMVKDKLFNVSNELEEEKKKHNLLKIVYESLRKSYETIEIELKSLKNS